MTTDNKQFALTDAQNAIIASHFPTDPANACRAHAAVMEILSKLGGAGEMSDEELLKWAGEEQFFLFCDEDDFLQIARAVLQRYATPQSSAEAVQVRRDTLLSVLGKLNGNPYSLTKAECLDVVREMFDEADKALNSVPAALSTQKPVEEVMPIYQSNEHFHKDASIAELDAWQRGWDESRDYDDKTLKEALAYLETIANFGGTVQQARELAQKGVNKIKGE